MGDIVNLRQARKQKARRRTEADASHNRVAFGRTKAERVTIEQQKKLEDRRLDQHRRHPGARNDDE